MDWKLDVNLLPEALQFIDSLDEKTREKVFFNIKKTRMGLTGEWLYARFIKDNSQNT